MPDKLDDIIATFERDVRNIFKLGESLQGIKRDEKTNTIDINHLKKKVNHYIKKYGSGPTKR